MMYDNLIINVKTTIVTLWIISGTPPVLCVSYDIAVDSHFLRWSYDNELCKSKSVYRMKQWTFVVSIDLYAYNVFVRMCVTMRNDSSINA